MTSRPFERLLIATGNKGKIVEFGELLSPLNITLRTLADFPHIIAPEETGTTFPENASIKAAYYGRLSGEWAVADDSGLEIDLLDGGPGVHSARFGGEALSYEKKMSLVLSKLVGAEEQQRRARFVCVIKVADPEGNVRITADGVCEGRIADHPRGSNGFGYDPIFIPDGFDLTFGELSDEAKRSISHRGKASAELIRKMLDFTGV